jgi:hypothetical protein
MDPTEKFNKVFCLIYIHKLSEQKRHHNTEDNIMGQERRCDNFFEERKVCECSPNLNTHFSCEGNLTSMLLNLHTKIIDFGA